MVFGAEVVVFGAAVVVVFGATVVVVGFVVVCTTGASVGFSAGSSVSAAKNYKGKLLNFLEIQIILKLYINVRSKIFK